MLTVQVLTVEMNNQSSKRSAEINMTLQLKFLVPTLLILFGIVGSDSDVEIGRAHV